MFKLRIISILIALLVIVTFSSTIFADPSDKGLSFTSGSHETPDHITSIGTEDEPVEETGISASGEAAVTLHQNLKSIFVAGYNNNGLITYDNASIIASDFIKISTSGDVGHAVFVRRNGTITFNDSVEIITKGEGATGVRIYANSSKNKTQIIFNGDVKITTYAKDARGVYTYSTTGGISEITLGGDNSDNIIIDTFGENAYGVYGYVRESEGWGTNEITVVGNAEITTRGKRGYGAAAAAAHHDDISVEPVSTTQIIFEEETVIITFGEDSYGAYAESSHKNTATITFFSDTTITTSEEGSYGVYVISGVESTTEILFKDEIEIATSGASAHGVYYKGGKVSFDNGATIHISGIESDVFYFKEIVEGYFPVYSNIIATSEKRNLIGSNADSKLEITFTDSSKLYGDLKGYSSGSDITLNLEDATTWEGNALIGGDGTYNVNLFDTSSWIIKKDSEVNNLNMENTSSISFIIDITNPVFSKATVGSLTGLGIIKMNVDLSADNPDGDFLQAESASGNYSLIINHNGFGGAKELALVEVEIPDGNLTFTLSEEKVQIGAYNYILDKRGIVGSATAMEWFLKLLALDIKVEEETEDSVIGLGEFAKSIDATLSDEFLRPKNKLWFASFYKLQEFDEEVINTSLKQQIGGGVAGLDKVISDNLNVGQFFGLGVAYQNIGEGSVGHIASLTMGIYANYINNGFLTSGYIRVANYIHDLRLQGSSNGTASGTMNTYGWSASIQLSQKIFPFNSDIYITPKAKATYTYVKEQSYDIGGMSVRNLDTTGLVTWIGARVGIEKSNNYDKPYGYYLEAGWIHDTNPSVTVIITDGEAKTMSLGNNRFEAGIGFYTSPLGVSSFDVELKYSKGKGIEELIKVNIGGSVYF